MSDETTPKKPRLMSLVDSGVKYNVCNNKRRRLCSVSDCGKQAQRKGLCARHLTQSKNHPQPPETVTTSVQSAADSTTERPEPISSQPLDVTTLAGTSNDNYNFSRHGELFIFHKTLDPEALLL